MTPGSTFILSHDFNFHSISTRFDSFQWRFSMFRLLFSTRLNYSPNPYLFRFFSVSILRDVVPPSLFCRFRQTPQISTSKTLCFTSFSTRFTRLNSSLHSVESGSLSHLSFLPRSDSHSVVFTYLRFKSSLYLTPTLSPCCDKSTSCFILNSLWLVSSRSLSCVVQISSSFTRPLPFLTWSLNLKPVSGPRFKAKPCFYIKICQSQTFFKSFSYSFFAPIYCDSVVPPSRSSPV